MRWAGIVIIAALALAGCVRVDTSTVLSPDDTFTQHAIVAIEPGALAQIGPMLGSAGALPDGVEPPDESALADLAGLLDPDAVREQLAPLEEAVPGSVEVEAYSDDDGREGVEITLTDIPLDVARDAGTTGLATGVGASPTIAREGDAFVVTIDTGAASAVGSAGLDTRALALAGSAVDFSVAFTFPGLVREANAGEVEGNTVTLGLADLLGVDQLRLVGGADTQRDWGPLLRWLLVGLAAAALVAGATLLVVQDRRRRRETHLPPPDPSDGGPGTLPREP